MRKKIIGCIIFLSFAALLSGGCAKKEVVRTDEQVPVTQPAQRPADTETTRPAPVQAPTRIEPTTPLPESTPTEGTVRPEAPATPAGREDDQYAALQRELQAIYFNFDSATLSDEARATLSKDAELLAKRTSVKISVEGHTDERGSDDYNMALGERRAKAARDYLVNLGIQPERISVISYGEEKPAQPGSDEDAWSKNRRAEIVIVK
jgi:peptidoglycan-associated lipoprotein